VVDNIPERWEGFAGAIAGRLKVTEVSVVAHPDDPLKAEGKVITEIDVTEGAHIPSFFYQKSLDVLVIF
jgi:hypothetical protein